MRRWGLVLAGLGLAGPAWGVETLLSPGDDLGAFLGAASPGSVFTLKDGVYEITGTLNASALSTADEPVIIQAANGATPILRAIDGGLILNIDGAAHLKVDGITFEGGEGWEERDRTAIRIVNSTFVTLTGLEIRNFRGNAVQIDGNNDGIEASRNHIHNLTNAAFDMGCGDASCWTQNSTFAENWIHDQGVDGETWRSAVYLDQGTQNVTFRDNVIYRTFGRGVYAGSTEFGEPNIIEGNAIWDVREWGIRIEGSARVRNNVVLNVLGRGIISTNNDREGLVDTVISFNTVSNTTDWALHVRDWRDRDGMVLANNAIINPIGYGFRFEDSEEFTENSNYIKNNIVTGLVQGYDPLLFPDWIIAGGGTGDVVDASTLDFYPSERGLLVDAADPSGESWVPETDFNGAARDGAAPDVGAYEWDGAENPGWAISEGFKELGADIKDDDNYTVESGCCKKKDGVSDAAVMVPLLGLLAAGRRRRARA